MRKVINSKVYDTETAQLLHVWNNGLNDNSLEFCEQRLYKAPDGKYFLYGFRGPRSKCNSPHRSNIGLLSDTNLRAWLKSREVPTSVIDTRMRLD